MQKNCSDKENLFKCIASTGPDKEENDNTSDFKSDYSIFL